MKLHDLILPEKVEFNKEQVSQNYGRFVIEPYERGYGHTIGNSLRRILLSSLEGAAVTAVRVPGAPHEYSVVRGVKEDVMGIVLNLRQLRFKLYSKGPEILKLSVSRKSEVKASDFETNANVEIINKDAVVAHLDSGGKLDLEIEISWGRGYLPAERNHRADRPVEFVATDALFSPVSKVYYEVNNARVGQITDYDSLALEIWTDGSVTPLDAMTYASKILKDSISCFLPEDERSASASVSEEKSDESAESEIFTKSVAELNLSVRALNCLKNSKIATIGELVSKTEDELLSFKNFGKVSLNEIKEKLTEMQLSLGMQR